MVIDMPCCDVSQCPSGGPTVYSGSGMVIDIPCCDVGHKVSKWWTYGM